MDKDTSKPLDQPFTQADLPVFRYDLIENYEGEGYALFRARGRSAFGRRVDGEFYALTGEGRVPLGWQPEMFAPVTDEQAGSFYAGL